MIFMDKLYAIKAIADAAAIDKLPLPGELSSFENLGPHPESKGLSLPSREGRYYAFLYGVAQLMSEGLIVELGAYSGVSSTVLKIGGTRAGLDVLTVDTYLQPGTLERCRERNIIPVQGHSHYVARLFDKYFKPKERFISLLFIDTEHDGLTPEGELTLWGPWVMPGGLIVFDDIELSLMVPFWNKLHSMDKWKGCPKVSDRRLHPISGFGYMLVTE